MSQPKKKKSPSSISSSPAVEMPPMPVIKAAHRQPWLWPSIVVAAMVVIVGAGAVTVYALQASKIIRSTTIVGVDVGGKTTTEALPLVERAWKAYQSGAIVFHTSQGDISLDVVTVSASADDAATELATLSPVEAVNAAYAFGHRGSMWKQLRERISGFLGRPHAFGVVAVARATIETTLGAKTSALNVTPQDAAITVDGPTTSVTMEKNGQRPDLHQAALVAAHNAQQLNNAPVNIVVKTVVPTFVKNTTLESLATQNVPGVLDRAPLTLKLADQTWTIDRTKLGTLLGFRLNAAHQIQIGFDQAKTVAYLESIRNQTDVSPQDARFQVVNGIVQAFSTSRTGRTMDTLATLARLNQALDTNVNSIDIVYTEQQPTSSAIAANNLGIKELVAEATTNFAGSPMNRRYNLTFGAQKLNGLLIQPGETFSLIKALGHIDASTGWKSELVIKPGGIIKPEYGGGLCQVGTTLFRVALNAGLPIVERSNHSLRIHYYEPPVGLDATIYEPKPDLRFTNDYAEPLLLQTEVNGNNLTFSFYGTKDGRTVNIPTPRVYNITAIPAPKTIEVADLKPGQKVCQTPGHAGADATATYTVTKADGTKKTQVFQSHYMAVGIICRVGVKAKPTPKPKTTTNTNANTNTSTTNTNVPMTNTNTTTDTNTSTNTNSGT